MESVIQDLRYALRCLRRSPGSSTFIVMTLALAMGTGAVMFTVIATVLQILPVSDRSRVVYLASTDPRHGRPRTTTSPADFLDWKAQATSFDAMGALTFGTVNLSGVDTPLRLSSVKATADLFGVFGVTPDLGRTFRADEDRPGGNRVGLLTNRLWRSQFASNPSVVGQTLRLDGEPCTIVGVLPALLDAGIFRRTDVWLPLALDVSKASRDQRVLGVFGHLAPGRTRGQSSAELAAIAERLQQQYTATNSGIGARRGRSRRATHGRAAGPPPGPRRQRCWARRGLRVRAIDDAHADRNQRSAIPRPMLAWSCCSPP